jgi:carboxymethylenebutenolidase
MRGGTTIVIDAAGGPAEAYLAGSDGDPGLLVYADGIGLRPQIEEMADRIAAWGYLVLAPHLFYRDGGAAELAPKRDLRQDGELDAFFAAGAMDRIGTLTPEIVAADAEAWMGALRERAGAGPVGTAGYCVGAAFALRLGGQFPAQVAAVGGFHGGNLVTEAGDSPHLAIAGTQAAYCFGHADKDQWMPPEAVATLEETLAEAGRPHVNEVYDGAPHGYTMADTSTYDAAAAERHFAALRELLDATLR